MAHEKLRPKFTFDDNKINQFKQIVPECFEDGIINFETLRQNLGDWAQEEDDETLEHFGLFWPGKKTARKLAAIASEGTLEPAYGEGLKPDGTPDSDGKNDSKNIFIEGENLEVLKILQKSYANRIKMIYIDPPYNTGKDFIYDDNFTEPLNEYFRRTGQIDEEGKPLTTNKRSDGRFHSKWLSMMYPRLRIAYSLLNDDGVIFVSIADQEYHNLKSIMDEVFGPENFIANFIWNTDGHTDNQLEVKTNHEYILCYSKNPSTKVLNDVIDPNTRSESNLYKGFAENSITKNGPKNPPSRIRLKKGFPCIKDELYLPKTEVKNSFFSEVEKVGHINREITKSYGVSYPIRLSPLNVKNGKLQEDMEVFAGWANSNKLKHFMENNFNPITEVDGEISFYLSSKGVIYYKKEREGAKNILSVLKGFMTTEKMRSSLENNGIYFSYPKPVDLLEYLIKMGLKENEIVMDFFAGSGSTGHAFYNFVKNGEVSSSYILVQMLEKTNEDSLAYQKGFRTIPEITKKRLEIFSNEVKNKSCSTGFKYYKMKYSNYKKWQDVQSTKVEQLEMVLDEHANSPLMSDWSKNKLLTEIQLLEGFPLDSRIESSNFGKNEVNQINHEDLETKLLICLDAQIEENLIVDLKLDSNTIFICLDTAISNQDKLRLSDKGLIKTI
jgi:adenine-specific DNA-methyltransferase